MDNQTYFNGDFWQCATDTSTGESPATTPAKWRKLRIPKEWRRVLAKLTFASLLELDGQTDKAKIHRDTGEALLDDLVRQAAAQELNSRNGSVHLPQGQAVAASVILDDAYGLMRWVPEDLEASEKADGRRSLSMALQQMWEAWWWNSLMLLEQTALRPLYVDGDFQAQGTEVYFAATEQYYLAIQPSIAIPPATLTGGNYVLNSGFWALSQRCYTGDDVDNTKSYAWGTQVRNPVDGLFYQRGGSFQVTGMTAGFVDPNTDYTITPRAVDAGSRTSWWTGSVGPAATPYSMFIANPNWVFTVQGNGIVYAKYTDESGATLVSPDLVTAWTIAFGDPGSLPGPTIATFAAPAPPDTGHWGLLTPFDPTLTIATTVRKVARENPTLYRHTEGFEFEPIDGGVRVPCWQCGTAWVWSRRVTPVLTGNDFDSTATYVATPAEELVYDA
jgi:hypothetical protein